MPLWGNSTADESKPKYLHAGNIHHHYDPNKCYATMRGWEIVDENDIPELLVAIPGLSDSLVGANISAVEWGDGNYYSANTQTVVVVYNEQVVVTGHPTLVVTGSISGAITATHSSNYRNKMTFTFTIPSGIAQSFTVADQSIDLNGGTINDADGLLSTSSVVITAGIAAAIYPLAAKVVTVESITIAALSAGTYYGTEASHTLTVTFSAPVTVGAGTARTIATVWSGTSGPVGPVATYASGSTTTALVFTIAAIPDEAGTLSLATQSLGGTALLRDPVGGGVSPVISAAVATATGTKVVLPTAPVTVVWDATTPFLKNTAEYLLVNYGAAVTVAGGTPTVLVNWSGNSGPTLLASYVSGTGSTALRFDFTIPDEGGTASFVAKTILGTGTMKGSHSDTVNHIIAAGAVAATGTKVVAP